MALLTQEQVDAQRTVFVGINKDNGLFQTTTATTNSKGEVVKGISYFAGIEGELVGISTHIFNWQDKQKIKKLDIVLQDDGRNYQLQMGFYTYNSLSILNALSNIPNNNMHGRLKLTTKKDGSNISLFANWNNKQLKWKHSFKELKLEGLEVEKKEKLRNNLIDKMYENLAQLFETQAELNDEETAEEVPF